MYEVVALICIVIFFQIVIYKIGYMQGEQSAYKRFDRVCNVCRNKKWTCRKNWQVQLLYFLQQFGKAEQLEVDMRYTPFENVIAVKEITQFMIAHDLPKERVIEVLNDMISLIDKKPNYYFSREHIKYLKQIIIKNDR